MFEYGDFLVTYLPHSNAYDISSMSYVMRVGVVTLADGPGWVMHFYTGFADESILRTLLDFISDLNEELVNA